ncbi:hypothetical protein H6G97_33550 [Nostoc flagelliforme FACHB-838]|uniref:Uncharacterized protein n=1 Tax=Nostoc flagelliforme FACHB-838 TaxID=2692904 RepID=A0ABR8DXY5_9NOSO|nr:hypothetical protein [Nostoc flagelliforme]MBD2534190.1 hypothetical protein [Nostoc flagelliforme FACHB-838]
MIHGFMPLGVAQSQAFIEQQSEIEIVIRGFMPLGVALAQISRLNY